jgi:hypothetical protein
LVSGTVAVKSVSGNEMWKYCERGCNYGERTTSIEIIGMGNVSAVLSGKDFIDIDQKQYKIVICILIVHKALNEIGGYIKYEQEIRV